MDAASWIAIAFVLGLGIRQLGLPPLVGYLAAGFALNAAGAQGGAALANVAHLGVLLLLFTVGLKLRLQNLVQPEVFGVTLLHLLLTVGVLAPALHLGFALAWTPAAVLAIAFGFSSTVLAAKVLDEKRELRAFHGRLAIGILVVQDLVAVALLSVVGDHHPSLLGFVVLGLPLLRPLLHRVLDFSGHDELLILCGLLFAVVLGGLGFEHLGLSSELGALIFGALLSGHRRAVELSHALWGLREVFLIGFFLQIGMSGLPTLHTLALASLVALALPLKALLFFLILARFRLRARTAFLSGLSLATFSEFGLILAQFAAGNGLLDPHWVVMLALAVAISFAFGAPLNRIAHPLYERLAHVLDAYELEQRHPDEQPLSLGKAQILIMGMGRVGTGAYDFLSERGLRVVGLDSDPAKAAKHVHEGRRVAYADAEDPGLWHNLRLEGVRAVLLALPDLEAKRIATRQLRLRAYNGLISATSVFPEESASIAAAGADLTFNYFDQVGVGFAEHVWEALDTQAPEDVGGSGLVGAPTPQPRADG